MPKDQAIIRLKKVILNDKINMPSGLIEILKKDMRHLLESYFELSGELELAVETDSEGLYTITALSKAERVKSPKFI